MHRVCQLHTLNLSRRKCKLIPRVGVGGQEPGRCEVMAASDQHVSPASLLLNKILRVCGNNTRQGSEQTQRNISASHRLPASGFRSVARRASSLCRSSQSTRQSCRDGQWVPFTQHMGPVFCPFHPAPTPSVVRSLHTTGSSWVHVIPACI